MPHGTLQLIYIGEQNLYITENPQITFFKTIYKRHTNFSIDTIQEFFNGKINFGQQIKCKLSKNGDLLSRMGMYIKLSSFNENKQQLKCQKNNYCLCTCSKCLLGSEQEDIIYGWANAIGHVLLEWIEIYIGGQLIDRHYGEWLEIWTELTQTSEKRLGYYEMIGKKDPLAYTVDSFTEEMELYVPFNFWFCRNIGLALPVMCLLYHDIEFIIKIRDFDQCWVSNKASVPRPKASIDACILADYIYLSIEERHKFYTESHVYLIEQLQLNENNNSESNTGNMNIDLCFNNPIKELIWFLQRKDVLGPSDGVWPEDCSYPKGNDHFNFTTAKIPRLAKLTETFSNGRILLSGVDRTSGWPASYFRLWQNYFYHTRIPTANYIYTYSFGLSPEDHQPSGECNMSMVDNARLSLKLLHKHKVHEKYAIHAKVYATNYQILLVTAGMGATIFN
jgi:hypothetical protein